MDDWERLFEKSVKEFGLLMHSFRCRDELNEFWEANFRAGQFRQPFVVRSLRSMTFTSEPSEPDEGGGVGPGIYILLIFYNLECFLFFRHPKLPNNLQIFGFMVYAPNNRTVPTALFILFYLLVIFILYMED